jgi:hypothetical protein
MGHWLHILCGCGCLILVIYAIMHVQEIWDDIASYLPAFSAANAARAFHFKRTITQQTHYLLWHSIFKDEVWLQLAAKEHNVNPVLIGPNLHPLHNKTNKQGGVYLVLLAGDVHGDLRYEREAFFASLQEHKFNEAKDEILFDCGITLNVSQVLRGCNIVKMANPRMLFNKKKLRTTYCFWEDKEKMLRAVKRPHIIGIGGEITRVEEIFPIFSIRLSSSNGHTQNQIFMDYSNARVTPIFKRNEGRTNGEIQGWELR